MIKCITSARASELIAGAHSTKEEADLLLRAQILESIRKSHKDASVQTVLALIRDREILFNEYGWPFWASKPDRIVDGVRQVWSADYGQYYPVNDGNCPVCGYPSHPFDCR